MAIIKMFCCDWNEIVLSLNDFEIKNGGRFKRRVGCNCQLGHGRRFPKYKDYLFKSRDVEGQIYLAFYFNQTLSYYILYDLLHARLHPYAKIWAVAERSI
jgi:hypothetical protein